MADAAHAAGDIWHRSLEDLLKAIETAEAKATSSISFAINLHSSTTPIAMPVAAFPRFERLRVYQIEQPGSGGSMRFQLRLGIIQSDLEADAILSTVRKYYPGATKEASGEADRTAVAQPVSSVPNESPTRNVAKVSPMSRPPSKDVVAPSKATPAHAKADAAVEPLWNIDELLPNLADPGAAKPDRTPRAGMTPRIHQPTRTGAPQVRLSKVAVARSEVAKPVNGNTAPPAAKPLVPKVAAATKAVEAVTAPAANAPVPTAPADTGRLRSLVARIGTFTVSPSSTPVVQPVVPKAPPETKPAEALKGRQVDAPVETSIADSGLLRSLVAKIGTFTVSPSPPVVQPVPQKAPPEIKPTEAVTAPALTAAATASAADTGTLQSLVAKIGTLVDAVETHAEATPAPRPVVTPVPAAPTVPVATVASARVPAPALISGASTAVKRVLQKARAQPSAPRIDSTQTFRALTAVELSDAEASQWFVIQLMQSAELIDPEQVPKLDIFTEYRLYSVCEPDQDQFIHALRLGFFSSEIAAQAVAGYLNSHFPTTNIKRVSIAERDRFAEIVAKKDVGEAGNHTVIEIAPAPALPAPVIAPAATPSESDKRPGGASLWSRLTRLRGA